VLYRKVRQLFLSLLLLGSFFVSAANVDVGISTFTGTPGEVARTQSISYLIEYDNETNITAESVVVKFLIPPTTQVDSHTSSKACTTVTEQYKGRASNFLRCPLGNLLGLQSGSMRVVLKTTDSTPTGVIYPEAHISATNEDPSAINDKNVLNTHTTITEGADLEVVSLSPSKSEVFSNESFSYGINVRNNGPDPASSTTVTFTLPSNLELVEQNQFAPHAGWLCKKQTGGAICNPTTVDGNKVQVLSSGDNHTLNFSVRATGNLYGSVTSVASISSQAVELNNTNNQASNDVTILRSTDVTVDASTNVSSGSAIETGEAHTYTVTVFNRNSEAPHNAVNPRMRFTLATGVVFDRVVAANGWQCANSGQVITCTAAQLNYNAGNAVFTIHAKAPASVPWDYHPYQSSVVVDTHVGRISRRLALTKAKDAIRAERDLVREIPRNHWVAISHRLIQHGRATCLARKPRCAGCGLEDLCPQVGLPRHLKKSQ